jgi:hypothetical protein
MSSVVYILVTGEKYEGFEIVGVFSTIEKAQSALSDYITNSHKQFHFDKSSGQYIGGCDYIAIEARSVL